MTALLFTYWKTSADWFLTDNGKIILINNHTKYPIVRLVDAMYEMDWDILSQQAAMYGGSVSTLLKFLVNRRLCINVDGNCYSRVGSGYYYYGKADMVKVWTVLEVNTDYFVYRELERLHEFVEEIVRIEMAGNRDVLKEHMVEATEKVGNVIKTFTALCTFFTVSTDQTVRQGVLSEVIKLAILSGRLSTKLNSFGKQPLDVVFQDIVEKLDRMTADSVRLKKALDDEKVNSVSANEKLKAALLILDDPSFTECKRSVEMRIHAEMNKTVAPSVRWENISGVFRDNGVDHAQFYNFRATKMNDDGDYTVTIWDHGSHATLVTRFTAEDYEMVRSGGGTADLVGGPNSLFMRLSIHSRDITAAWLPGSGA
uniref:2b protein n=1 Tax=Tobacco rattle virus TaxID=12295 RepID=W0NTC4_9VIRU|nr:putative protein 2b [Tobacco rattle virus]